MTIEPLIQAERDGSWVTVRWHGDVDMANAAEVERLTLGAIENTDEGVTIDLSRVDYIDSAGIRTLVGLQRLTAERQLRISAIVPPGSLLTKALEVGGVVALISTHESEEAAREAR